MRGFFDLFDLDGDGKLDGVEMAFGYEVLFGDDDDSSDDDFEDDDDW